MAASPYDVAAPFDDDYVFTGRPIRIHLHTPSEHTVDGKSHDGEIHLVHEYQMKVVDEDGEEEYKKKKFILAVFLSGDGTEENTLVQGMIDVWAGKSESTVNMETLESDLNLVDFWFYEGSTTQPPCNTFYKWYVLETPLKITSAQLEAI